MSDAPPELPAWRARLVPILSGVGLAVMLGAGLPWAWGNVPALAGIGLVSSLLAAILVIAWREQDARENQLRRLQRENADLSEFVSVTTHDLHEPLRKIEMFGQRLLDSLGPVPDEKQARYLERMTDGATRLRDLLDKLKTHARIRDDLTRTGPVALDDILARIAQDRVQQPHSITVEPLPTVEADPDQMRILFENLIDNALKYRQSDANVDIRISVRSEADTTGGLAVIEVSDTGIGFDNRYSERIFGLLDRLHSRDAYPGSGVGLATCRKIVERHGGGITARGEEGKGACFTLILPRHRANLEET
ncbi:sensor histidine kinase [Maricaulis parjimensis]|uniref:sensor histidine kinase n=1 Tax=Maricaulis parjimensis TaxID=144023 RepID=UPI0019392E64|nr:ATP-binding protein [Maricaulis parjimensis]